MPASLLTVTPLTASGISHVFDNIPYGVMAWYDASKISGIASGTSLSALTDLSGNALHLSQASVTLQPVYTTSSTSMNGLPVITFDGSNDVMSVTSSWGVIPFSFAAAFYFRTAANVNVLGFRADEGLQREAGAAGKWLLNQGGSTFSDSVGTASRSYTITASYETNGSVSTLRCQNSSATSSFLFGNPAGVAIGTNLSGGAPAAVDIGELIVYPRALSLAEYTQVETYLRTKWGTL